MIEKALTVTAEEGLHARPASATTNVCQKYKADIKFSNGTQTIDPKSILGIMMLGAKKGDVLSVTADGQDEDQAMEALEELFSNGFRES